MACPGSACPSSEEDLPVLEGGGGGGLQEVYGLLNSVIGRGVDGSLGREDCAHLSGRRDSRA